MSDDDRTAKAKAALAKGVAHPNTIMANEDAARVLTAGISSVVIGAVEEIRVRGAMAGLWVTRANLLAIVMREAWDTLRSEDDGLAIEFIEAFAKACRTAHSKDGEAEHLEAMEALGVIFHQFSEIERRKMAEAQL